jgi:hypothetical protein
MRTKRAACLLLLVTAASQMQGCVDLGENGLLDYPRYPWSPSSPGDGDPMLAGKADPAVYREVWDRISKTGIDLTARRRELYETYRKNVEELNMERETRGLQRIEPLGYKSWTRGVESAAPTR